MNRCLVVLGMPEGEVNVTRVNRSGNRVLWGAQGHCSHVAARGPVTRTIYERYTTGELLELVDYYYKEAKRKWHPDIHPEQRGFYEEKFKGAMVAYDKATRILYFRGKCH